MPYPHLQHPKKSLDVPHSAARQRCRQAGEHADASASTCLSPPLQHPEKSLDVRGIAAKLGRKKRYGVADKVRRRGWGMRGGLGAGTFAVRAAICRAVECAVAEVRQTESLQVLLLMEMLRAEPWCYYPLALQVGRPLYL